MEAYVICVNDYPVEVSLLSEEEAQGRVEAIQERLDKEDGIADGGFSQRFVHYHPCPIVREAKDAARRPCNLEGRRLLR